jgi:hypothetical protein
MDLLVTCDASLGGTRMAGLRKRREMERTLYLEGKYGDLSTIPFWRGDPRKTKRQEYEVQDTDL